MKNDHLGSVEKADPCSICGGVTFELPVEHFCPQSFFPQLLRDECLVRIEKPERMTVTRRLWIPETAQRDDFEMYQAVVLAAGPGRRKRKNGELDPIEVSVGDHVLVYFHEIEAKGAVRYGGREDLRIVASWQMQLKWPSGMTLAEAMR